MVQVFKFPGFFDREIDLTAETVQPQGTPAGVIGASDKGPAFVPRTIGSFEDFKTKFGTLNPKLAAPYAVNQFLENKNALTFMRVLGAGSNENASDIDTTRVEGTVKNAGFTISSSLSDGATSTTLEGATQGSVQFLVAKHIVSSSEAFGMPMFTDNQSYFNAAGNTNEAHLTRGVLFTAHDTRFYLESLNTGTRDAVSDTVSGSFKIVISSSAGSSFATTDGNAGLKIVTASMDPSADDYFGKVLNKNPEKFSDEKHLLYADFAVDAELAEPSGANSVAITSGSQNTSSTSGDTSQSFLQAFGRFDTRFKTPQSPWIISQPFGKVEHRLFRVESLSDGAYANDKIKISITDLQKSANEQNPYGTFTLLVRNFDDTDLNPEVLEQFPRLSLDPDSDNYIAKVIGDKRIHFNFDAANESDQRLLTEGKHGNKSNHIRVVMGEDVEEKKVPEETLPFGFEGPEVLNTNGVLTDTTGSNSAVFTGSLQRMFAHNASLTDRVEASIVPPLPYRFKVTRGDVDTSGGGLRGAPGSNEIVDARFHWGVKTTRNKDATNPNVIVEQNDVVKAYTKFNGISKLDTVTTGSGRDKLNSNKFTLARVALGNSSLSEVTSSANVHMKEAAYIRNGQPSVTDYTVDDSGTSRVTFATLLNNGSSASTFNSFNNFARFTTILQGGFDGTNILDSNAARLNDLATSKESRGNTVGRAAGTFISPGFDRNQNGTGIRNNAVNSYRVASRIMTDGMTSNINLLSIPGQREPLVSDKALEDTEDFGVALYTMDVPYYNSNTGRIFDGEEGQYIDVDETANQFESRNLDSTFGAAYFPNVAIDDSVNQKRLMVPASVAALDALSFNDKVAFPWFAPAGFNRASLDFVKRTQVKINQSERERLFSVNINPIIKFPREGFVIFSQNTLEQAGSALQSINVQRMLINVKRRVASIGNRLLFENITPELRAQFVTQVSNYLNTVTSRAGISRFEVIADERNNTTQDENENRMNGRIVLVPVRAVEFVAIDFVITRQGTTFAT